MSSLSEGWVGLLLLSIQNFRLMESINSLDISYHIETRELSSVSTLPRYPRTFTCQHTISISEDREIVNVASYEPQDALQHVTRRVMHLHRSLSSSIVTQVFEVNTLPITHSSSVLEDLPYPEDRVGVIPLWKHAYCWTHTPTHSVRIIRDVLDRMGDSQRDGTSTIANICKGVAIEDLSREDLVEALTKSIATAAFLHELTLKTPQQQQHQARSSTRRRQGRGDDHRRGDDLQSFETPDWRQSTSQTPLTSISHQTSSGADVGPSFRDVGPSYVFSSPLSSSFFDFGQGSGGNDPADQGTAHQQSEFQTPPAYTTYQDSFMEGIFGGISHQYGGEHPTFDTSSVTYIGYSLPDSAAASASQVPPEYVEEREDDDDYQAPNIIRRSRRVPRAPDCGTGHRLGHRFGWG
ncbi:hypothetical protein F511_36041 [Dorcoceras hygrometricum]|uniref:Uncharacterized protein n=1 Tax=Dorcoceras hygrometricum TaxID=472368 RepID=A0A2Z7AHN8_9LAMI|nr:hypothetical protein F511_36041 [Dorcoceras hygrometricum]